MASPPFTLSTSTPGDSDIVSQFPLDERTLRDIIQSWLLIDHNNLGNHVKVSMPWAAPPATPAASVNAYYTNPDGNLAIIDPNGIARYVGPPVGTVFHFAGAVPNGYLVADGSAVSRSTFAPLFSVIGITFGAGNGSTTFNLPNITGRVIAGVDNAGVTLNAAGLGTAAVLTAVGGSQVNTLTLAQLPTGINVTGSLSLSISNVLSNPNGGLFTASAASGATVFQAYSTGAIINNNTGITASGNLVSNNTSGTAHPNVQPTLVLLPIIKY